MSQHAAKIEQIRALIGERPEQARALAQRLAQAAPRDADAQSIMSRGELRLGEQKAGLHFAQRAAELAPGDPMLLMILGEVLGYELQNEKALEVLDRAVALAPSHLGCLFHRAD